MKKCMMKCKYMKIKVKNGKIDSELIKENMKIFNGFWTRRKQLGGK